jgi:hypothetical protein
MKRTKHGDEGDIDRRLAAGIMRSQRYKEADHDAGMYCVGGSSKLGYGGLCVGHSWWVTGEQLHGLQLRQAASAALLRGAGPVAWPVPWRPVRLWNPLLQWSAHSTLSALPIHRCPCTSLSAPQMRSTITTRGWKCWTAASGARAGRGRRHGRSSARSGSTSGSPLPWWVGRWRPPQAAVPQPPWLCWVLTAVHSRWSRVQARPLCRLPHRSHQVASLQACLRCCTSSPAQDQCRLCFASAARPRHLAIAIGQSSYLALPARGRLVPGHCVIVPAEHVASTRQVDEQVRVSVYISTVKEGKQSGVACLYSPILASCCRGGHQHAKDRPAWALQ